jgi:hypothetical protein
MKDIPIWGHQWALKWIPEPRAQNSEQNQHSVKVVGKDDMENSLIKGYELTTRKHGCGTT